MRRLRPRPASPAGSQHARRRALAPTPAAAAACAVPAAANRACRWATGGRTGSTAASGGRTFPTSPASQARAPAARRCGRRQSTACSMQCMHDPAARSCCCQPCVSCFPAAVAGAAASRSPRCCVHPPTPAERGAVGRLRGRPRRGRVVPLHRQRRPRPERQQAHQQGGRARVHPACTPSAVPASTPMRTNALARHTRLYSCAPALSLRLCRMPPRRAALPCATADAVV